MVEEGRGRYQRLEMKILICNVRGLGLCEKRGAIRRFIKKCRVYVFLIQETKKEDLSPILVRELWGINEVDYFFKPFEGQSGGLAIFWNSSEIG